MQGDFHGMEGPKAGTDFPGSVSSSRFEMRPPPGKAALDDILAEAQSTLREKPLTDLRPTGMTLGYLLNFGAALMKYGITRTVSRLVAEDQ